MSERGEGIVRESAGPSVGPQRGRRLLGTDSVGIEKG
jgi:hypothetical protein